MNADAYQTAAARTLIDEPDSEYTGNQIMLVWTALGLTGESGEVAEHIKKAVFHQHGLDRDKLIKELGDVAWYLAGLATLIGVPLSEVFDRNIAKLKERYPNGYSSGDSKARVDTKRLPFPGAVGTCTQCGKEIGYIGSLWDSNGKPNRNGYWFHPDEITPRHPAIPVEYDL